MSSPQFRPPEDTLPPSVAALATLMLAGVAIMAGIWLAFCQPKPASTDPTPAATVIVISTPVPTRTPGQASPSPTPLPSRSPVSPPSLGPAGSGGLLNRGVP